MTPLLLLAAASADLDALEQAVTHCDRKASNPVFASEAARRAQFLLDAYRDQEAIVNDRLALADEQRQARTGASAKPSDSKQLQKQLDVQQADLDDRQKALNDKRLLEGMRQDAMDSMRRFFLNNCPAGGSEKVK